MRCPKCHYISFDADLRCRNCGYDFALTAGDDRDPADLTLRVEEAPVAPADLPLGLREDTADSAGRRRRSGAAGPADLPLFEHERPAEEVPRKPAASPRPPLAVRRPVRETPRPHSAAPRADPVPVRPDAPARDARPGLEEARESGTAASPARGPEPRMPDPAAVPGARRLAALAVDAAILGGIDLLVLVFTLRLTGLELARAAELAGAPLAAFLLLLDGGYLVLFTAASGQTIGKMLVGVRVVTETGSRVALGTAAVRAAASLVTLLTAGAGYLPALVSRDRRALHDRLARTRVVRA